ncbi:MAG: glycosyltransferase family 2 protein [Caldilineaceae bacterium]|nr:glycosyltransferase family 2 protein [Caldilineaceae bacterium]
MHIIGYQLHNQAVAIEPSSLPTGSQGWMLRCPLALEATWNGGSAPTDITIRLVTEEPPLFPFVASVLGAGILTFYSGYQFQSDPAHILWARGPLTPPKEGIYPLDQSIDTSLLPYTVSFQWQFTRPHQTIRFAAGEPFATLLLWPKPSWPPVQLQVVPPLTEVARYEENLQELIDDPVALQALWERLGAVPTPLPEPTAAPQPTTRVDKARSTATPRQPWRARLDSPPPVSCICPTYGRVALLEEAIYAFLQQDYPGSKELIVLNDYAEQTLQLDHPEVRIINFSRRFHSIGEKYKAAVALASHDLLFVWHDDDIYLPHRLSYSVAQFAPGIAFWKADKAWFWNNGTLSGPEQNLFHGGSGWRRSLFTQVHGYPHLGQRYDVEFEQLCSATAPGAIRVDPIQPADIYYLYRWQGTASYHLSAMGEGERTEQKVVAYVQERAAQGQVPQGVIQLKPHWKSDYSALVQSYLVATANGRDKEAIQAKAATPEAEIPFPPPYYVITPPPAMPGAAELYFARCGYPRTISVILPAANESVLLKRTVDQFVATLPANSEIIVVDNGSTDGSADFLAAGAYEQVQLIQSAELLGVAGARNRGLAAAQGEIVVFADAHIDLPQNWWQPLVSLLQRPAVGIVGPAIGVMGKPQHPAACGQRIAEARLRVEWLPWKGQDPYPVPTLGGGFMAMRRTTLEQAGAFDAGMPQWGSEDLEICVRYWLLGYEVWVAPAVTVLHYFRKANPYKVEWGAVTHNLLRVALLHFSQARLARVVAALKSHSNFAQAMAYAVASDVWQKRTDFAARRRYDDDWLFEKFADSCEV